MISRASSISAGRAVLLGLAVGLSVAAAIAILALLTHSFDATDARLIATSLGFSVFSALGAAGAPARRQPKLAVLGALTTGAAGLGFALSSAIRASSNPRSPPSRSASLPRANSTISPARHARSTIRPFYPGSRCTDMTRQDSGPATPEP
jgi:hypothetical protein